MPAARLTARRLAALALLAAPARADDDRPRQRQGRPAAALGRRGGQEGRAQLVRAAAGQRARHASRSHEGAAERLPPPERPALSHWVTGRFRGTTDEVIQWAGAKWGLAPDLVRAVAAKETWWRMSHVGDNGDSFGLFQVRRPYHCRGTRVCGLFRHDAALNADYWGSIIRSYFDGRQTWLSTVAGNGARYAAGDLWGSIGAWFSGRWHDAGAEGYVAPSRTTWRGASGARGTSPAARSAITSCDMPKSSTSKDESPLKQIDARDRRAERLARPDPVQGCAPWIKQADPDVVEEWKWMEPPTGPVWSHKVRHLHGRVVQVGCEADLLQGRVPRGIRPSSTPASKATPAAPSTFTRARRSTQRPSRRSSAPPST